MKEIQQAQAIGIDGFALNVGSWLSSGGDVEEMMRRFVNYDRFADVYFRHDGKYVLTTFAGRCTRHGDMAEDQIGPRNRRESLDGNS